MVAVVPAPADVAVLATLAEARTHAVLRHALAPGTGDPPGFRLDDCTTQRNLSDAGRAQAQAIGAALGDAGVHIDRVLSSRWCRSLETAELLGLGPVTPTAPLDSFFAARAQRTAQTAATVDLLLALPPEVTAILVSHQVNVTSLTGIRPRSGELVVFSLDDAGKVVVRGRFLVPPPTN